MQVNISDCKDSIDSLLIDARKFYGDNTIARFTTLSGEPLTRVKDIRSDFVALNK